MNEDGAAARKVLNNYFGKKNAVTEIRNKVAFHYKDKNDLIEMNFQRLPDTQSHGNFICQKRTAIHFITLLKWSRPEAH
jgi:hypothetical protein